MYGEHPRDDLWLQGSLRLTTVCVLHSHDSLNLLPLTANLYVKTYNSLPSRIFFSKEIMPILLPGLFCFVLLLLKENEKLTIFFKYWWINRFSEFIKWYITTIYHWPRSFQPEMSTFVNEYFWINLLSLPLKHQDTLKKHVCVGYLFLWIHIHISSVPEKVYTHFE